MIHSWAPVGKMKLLTSVCRKCCFLLTLNSFLESSDLCCFFFNIIYYIEKKNPLCLRSGGLYPSVNKGSVILFIIGKKWS